MSQPDPAAAHHDNLSGRSLGGYRLLRLLGSGAMGDVYLAEQQSLGRQVAVKVLRGDRSLHPGAVERFSQEARAAAALVHGTIVQIHEVACVDGVHFLAEEYVAGPSLKAWLLARGPLDANQAISVLSQVGSALVKSAQAGIVHRDIKPENLLVTPAGEIKVADFGLARMLEDAISTYTAVSTRAATGSGHEKPWWYYLGFFGWHRDGGLLWQQLAFSTLAFCGVLVAFATPQKILRCAALYTFIIVGSLSLAPYTTPWHTVHLVPGFAFLAAGALAALPLRLFAFATAGIVLALQSKQTQLAAFLRPADARNPYAYVHSSPDVLKIRALAEAALTRAPAGPIRIISEEYWPIPWYLRALPPTAVGYWPTPPAISDGALIIASSTQAVALRPLLRARYHESYLGLRPGFLLVVFTPITATP
jgi:predicted Ser/Thr protein kinase